MHHSSQSQLQKDQSLEKLGNVAYDLGDNLNDMFERDEDGFSSR